jgi:hypothetical protein
MALIAADVFGRVLAAKNNIEYCVDCEMLIKQQSVLNG